MGTRSSFTKAEEEEGSDGEEGAAEMVRESVWKRRGIISQYRQENTEKELRQEGVLEEALEKLEKRRREEKRRSV